MVPRGSLKEGCTGVYGLQSAGGARGSLAGGSLAPPTTGAAIGHRRNQTVGDAREFARSGGVVGGRPEALPPPKVRFVLFSVFFSSRVIGTAVSRYQVVMRAVFLSVTVCRLASVK